MFVSPFPLTWCSVCRPDVEASRSFGSDNCANVGIVHPQAWEPTGFGVTLLAGARATKAWDSAIVPKALDPTTDVSGGGGSSMGPEVQDSAADFEGLVMDASTPLPLLVFEPPPLLRWFSPSSPN
jgi:hypothetical protein